MACEFSTSGEVAEGREPDQEPSTQVQGGSRLKESSGYPALRHSEPVMAIAHAAESTRGVQQAGEGGSMGATGRCSHGGRPSAELEGPRAAAEGAVGMVQLETAGAAGDITMTTARAARTGQ